MPSPTKTLFQGLLSPDTSGKLPRAEGAFLYQQSYNNNSGGAKTFPLSILQAADDYFLVLINACFAVTGGNNPFIRAYPPGTSFSGVIDGNDKAGLDIFAMVFPARVPIPARWQIEPLFMNAANASFGTVSLYGVQLFDCVENCNALLRTGIL